MKKVLIICTTPRDKRELSFNRVRGDYDIVFHDFDADLIDRVVSKGTKKLPAHLEPEYIIKELATLAQEHKVDGLLATDDYPGSLFASFMAQELGLYAPSLESILICQHKYYARCAQRELVPDATPHFTLIDAKQDLTRQIAHFSFPFFLKPVKSYFSLYANKVTDMHDLEMHTQQPIKFFLYHFDWFLKQYPAYDVPAHYLIAEGLLQGVQVTLEGYVYNGQVAIQGIVDSIMFPGTICFARFDYPSFLPQEVQERMGTIAKTFMQGIGFDNGIFNIEFMYNSATDAIDIIEVNPRMASQFADLFEKVDGTNSYQTLLALATGTQPLGRTRQGNYACATSYVLRIFDDHHIAHIPQAEDIEKAYKEFPDARIELFGRPGYKLSDELQDGKSFRYGLIHLGAQDWQELFEKVEACKAMLPYIMQQVH